ncbi:MAG: tetratricopeptide repeat protein [Bacteroidales bacterium]|nr:tetratricopeptide repeat protein [Bacteroidales bacterium]
MADKKKTKHRNNAKKPLIQALFSKRNAMILIALFAIILYGKSLSNKYALDDELVVHDNALIAKGFEAIPTIFTSFYAETEKMQYGYRPIVQMTFAIEHQFFGENPNISHLINLILYIFTGFILFKFLSRILAQSHLIVPLGITLLFMAHPAHTEVVCSLKNRDELLSFLGGMGAVMFMFSFVESKKIKFFVLANISLWLGFFSKLSALTFLAVIPLCLYFFTTISIKRNLIYSGITAFALLLLFYLSRLMLPEQIQPFSITENPLFVENGFLLKLNTGLYALWFYLKLLVFPHPLSFFYGYNMFPIEGSAYIFIVLSVIIYVFLLGYAIFKLKEKHLLSFIILFYLSSISMFTNILTPVAGIVGERFVYAASLSFCMALVYGFFKLTKTPIFNTHINPKSLNRIIILLLIFLLPYSLKTISRNNAWYDHKSLFVSDIEHLQNSAKANSLLAGTLFKEAIDDLSISRNAAKNKLKVDSALYYYNLSVEVFPEYSPSWNNMGSIYFVFYQDYQRAMPYFEKAIETDSNYVEPYFNLAYCHDLTGDTASAIQFYMKTIEKDSGYVKAYSNLSLIYAARGETELFETCNHKIMKIDPNLDVPYVNLGNYYLVNGDTTLAVEYMEKAFEKAPSNTSLAQNLVVYFENIGDIQKADYYRSQLR